MQYGENIRLALKGLTDHKFRSFLTMLGIIFGVASVITMLSIGEGAKREAIAKYQDLGVNNIIIREKSLSDSELEDVRAKFSQGLSTQDVRFTRGIGPVVEKIPPRPRKGTDVKYTANPVKPPIMGITLDFLKSITNSVKEVSPKMEPTTRKDLRCVSW